MGTNSAHGESNSNPHVIIAWEVDNDRLSSMEQRITESPRLLGKFAGKSSCCIFRVPQSLVEVNGKAYEPHIVSIGPYNHGQPQFKMIEEHKWRYLGSLLSRTKPKGLELKDYFKAIADLEVEARECYSQTIHLTTHEFLEMMVLDGCFIIELFRKAAKIVRFEPDDPLVTMAWIIPFFYRDFLRLENQIPFFILERLYELTKLPGDEESKTSLSLLALQFFNNAMQRPEKVIEKHRNIKGKHLLDLVRTSFIPPDPEYQERKIRNPQTHLIPCVSKLRRAGIELRPPADAESFLAVKFKRGVIEMPTVCIDDFMSSFLLNCVAFEQCYGLFCSKHFTTYATLIDCIVNTSRDVEYLCDQNIFENSFGNDAELARFSNNLGKDVAFDIELCYLSNLFNDVHEYYRNSWHVTWAGFKYTYFDTPWSFISALAALVLLLFTLAQTIYTVLGYYYDRNPRQN
ncbi:UPF0481 protein At3g47200 [Ziziphus jujuba]|nr:UPF0481 protein At3g47200 [Ziziphus jujuba]